MDHGQNMKAVTIKLLEENKAESVHDLGGSGLGKGRREFSGVMGMFFIWVWVMVWSVHTHL